MAREPLPIQIRHGILCSMLTRREMLKGMAAAAAVALTPRLTARAEPDTIPIAPEPEVPSDFVLTGRAIHTVAIYKEPSTSSERVTSVAGMRSRKSSTKTFSGALRTAAGTSSIPTTSRAFPAMKREIVPMPQ